MSNTKLLSDQFGWQGVLVEPSRDLFLELKKNRPSDFVANVALCNMTGSHHVNCANPADILLAANFSRFDVFSLNVEGHVVQVLSQLPAGIHIQVFIIESNKSNISAIEEELMRIGTYRLDFADGSNRWYVRNGFQHRQGKIRKIIKMTPDQTDFEKRYNTPPFVKAYYPNNCTKSTDVIGISTHHSSAAFFRPNKPVQVKRHNRGRSTYATVNKVCVSLSVTGSTEVLLKSPDAQKLCRNNVLDICLPSFKWSDKEGLGRCSMIACRASSAYENTSTVGARIAILSGRSHHFGWHAVLDNFIAYWRSLSCEGGKCLLEDSCPSARDVLFVDVETLDDIKVSSFLARGLLGDAGQVVQLQPGKILCYQQIDIGANVYLEGYNNLLRKKLPIFTSLGRCIRRLIGVTERHTKVLFLNREQHFGPRRVSGFREIAHELRHHPQMQDGLQIEYSDGFAHLDLVSQFRAFSQDTRVVVSPHGSQLTWLLFLERGSSVVEVFGEDVKYVHKIDYKDLANALNLQYFRWQGSGGRGNFNTVIPNSKILVEHILKIVGQLLKSL